MISSITVRALDVINEFLLQQKNTSKAGVYSKEGIGNADRVIKKVRRWNIECGGADKERMQWMCGSARKLRIEMSCRACTTRRLVQKKA
jgi:hypothetical protein